MEKQARIGEASGAASFDIKAICLNQIKGARKIDSARMREDIVGRMIFLMNDRGQRMIRLIRSGSPDGLEVAQFLASPFLLIEWISRST
jgi:hypothetical protein